MSDFCLLLNLLYFLLKLFISKCIISFSIIQVHQLNLGDIYGKCQLFSMISCKLIFSIIFWV